MNYWLSKRRIATRVLLERYCIHSEHVFFRLFRCPACGEIYLAELEHEYFYSRRDLRRVPHRLSHLWDLGCLKCGHINTSDGCQKWNIELAEVRASWWKWALPARLRFNRQKRARIQERRENTAILEKSRSRSCDACYNGLFR